VSDPTAHAPAMRERAHPARRSTLFAPFRYRDFRLLWTGLLISNLGTWTEVTSLGYFVVALAGTPARAALYVGVLGAVAAVPVLLLSPVAGVVADRYPRRRVLMITNLATATISLVLAILASTHRIGIRGVLLLAGLRAATAAFDTPTRQSWVSLLVPREYVGNAVGLNSIAFNAPSVVGPPVAGLMILSLGIGPSFFVNAVATFAVVLALVLMRPSQPSSSGREPVLAAIRAGVVFLWRHPVLRDIIATLFVTCLLLRPYVQLLPAYAAHVVHVDARGLGVLLAASGCGAIGGSVLTAMLGDRRRGYVWFGSGVVMALGVIGLSLTTRFEIAAAVLAFCGLSLLSFAGSANVLVQTLSPDEMRGRAVSVFSMIILGVVPAGSLVLGTLASAIGLPHALLVGGVVAFACILAIFVRNPALRRV